MKIVELFSGIFCSLKPSIEKEAETKQNWEGRSSQFATKRRVAICDATDEAKQSRCHMRVIMKKF